jgi:hypothetical protein
MIFADSIGQPYNRAAPIKPHKPGSDQNGRRFATRLFVMREDGASRLEWPIKGIGGPSAHALNCVLLLQK